LVLFLHQVFPSYRLFWAFSSNYSENSVSNWVSPFFLLTVVLEFNRSPSHLRNHSISLRILWICFISLNSVLFLFRLF
jgi:hypothetical protein